MNADKDMTLTLSGTGSFISPKQILTAYHVVKHTELENLKLEHETKNLEGVKINRILADPKADIALLELNKEVELDRYLSVGSVTDVKLAQEPFTMKLIHLSKFLGISSSSNQFFILHKDRTNNNRFYLLYTSTSARSGDSGSPFILPETEKILANS